MKSEQRMAFFVMESRQNENGEYQALIAKEGERGYYPTDWFWGSDLEVAEKIAKERNAAMDISEEEALRIVLSSMRKGR